MIINKVIQGNCLIKLKELPDNSVDSVVTDPPYELGFMGKSWDNTGIANNKEMWAECLRVLKPGGHLLSFGGTRTYHRMAVAIEYAGFEVRDMIEWIYGSGFPKSLNIGKAVDKLQGNDGVREKEIHFVKWLKSNIRSFIYEDIDKLIGTQNRAFHFFAESDSNRHIPNVEQYEKIKKYLQLDNSFDEFVKKRNLELSEIREIQGYESSIKNWDKKYNKPILNKAVSDDAKTWEGWGTALKPAHEPICMARKPLSEKTVAENVLKYGTGGINIDESRVGTEKITVKGGSKSGNGFTFCANYEEVNQEHTGRFPANLIHDNSEEVRECFPETKTNSTGKNSPADYKTKSVFGAGYKSGALPYEGDSGNASRFFKSIIYKSKASKRDRGEGNNHPTVKSVALMEYLIKMVTTKGGVVLDPFAGSGSTLVAAKQNGYQYIGIELTAEYIPIIEARLMAVPKKLL